MVAPLADPADVPPAAPAPDAAAPGAPPAPDAPADPAPPAAPAPAATDPRAGTNTCCPSTSFAARLTAARFALGAAPPARSSAAATRAPVGKEYKPGRRTAPATSIQISAAARTGARGRAPAGLADAGAAIEMLAAGADPPSRPTNRAAMTTRTAA